MQDSARNWQNLVLKYGLIRTDQRFMQNGIAKLVCAGDARSSDALCVHWLPINQRMYKFKLAFLTFKQLQHQFFHHTYISCQYNYLYNYTLTNIAVSCVALMHKESNF